MYTHARTDRRISITVLNRKAALKPISTHRHDCLIPVHLRWVSARNNPANICCWLARLGVGRQRSQEATNAWIWQLLGREQRLTREEGVFFKKCKSHNSDGFREHQSFWCTHSWFCRGGWFWGSFYQYEVYIYINIWYSTPNDAPGDTAADSFPKWSRNDPRCRQTADLETKGQGCHKV